MEDALLDYCLYHSDNLYIVTVTVKLCLLLTSGMHIIDNLINTDYIAELCQV